MTVLIALGGGALSGFIVSKLVDAPEEFFDDKQHFGHVEFPSDMIESIALQDLETNRKDVDGENKVEPEKGEA
jgi:hypothetical protein